MIKTTLLTLIASFFCAPAFADVSVQNFALEYEVIEAKAVCWQACRSSSCEESDFTTFFDTATFIRMAKLKSEGKTWRSSGLVCDEDIKFVEEHMPALQKSDPAAAQKIMETKGTPVRIVIYTDLSKNVGDFINNLLK